ncbi:MAG: SulP family inorganic anion transporter, partial [Acutalibacteraceae bacterium]|nr:SulP family inorganic anion transporter [Acutalibacteraceae bacterium]
PLSIALALASGVGPEQGLYTAIVAGFVISFLGGSRVQIAGPTAAFASIVAGIVAKNGFSGLVLATVIAGILLILMGVFKLGSLIKFIPYTITTGFTTGIAITIVIGQLKDFFGLTFTHSPIETIEKVEEVIKSFATFNWQALVIGAVSLAILIIVPKFLKKIPPSIIAIIVCAALVKIFDMNVNTIGDLYTISSAAPKLSIPEFSLDTVKAIMPDAFTIAVLAAVESLLSCVVADGMIGSRHNSNMELVAQGAGNICSALFGGIPATGAIARTAANIKNGGRTPIAGMVHAVVLLAVLLVLMPYASLIPMPTIAAILFIVAYNMSEWREFVSIIKQSPKSDTLILIVTFVLTVAFDLVVAICVGIILSTVMFMKRMSDVTDAYGWKEFDENNDSDSVKLKKIPDGAMVYEITGPIFFGASTKIANVIKTSDKKVIIIRMRSVPAIDATGIHSFESIIKACRQKNITLIMSHVNNQPMKVLKKSGMYKDIGKENICENIDKALARAAEILG